MIRGGFGSVSQAVIHELQFIPGHESLDKTLNLEPKHCSQSSVMSNSSLVANQELLLCM